MIGTPAFDVPPRLGPLPPPSENELVAAWPELRARALTLPWAAVALGLDAPRLNALALSGELVVVPGPWAIRRAHRTEHGYVVPVWQLAGDGRGLEPGVPALIAAAAAAGWTSLDLDRFMTTPRSRDGISPAELSRREGMEHVVTLVPRGHDPPAAAERRARGGTLVLGGGFAGAWVARLLGPRGATIVSPENFMLFTPLLPEAASATLEPRHVVVPLRLMCPRAEILLGRATALDEDARTVAVETADGVVEVAYDELVLALGSISRTLPVAGLAEHGRGFRDLADAIALRNHILRELEAADAAQSPDARDRHLSFVFVGAGYAGVEALAELADLVRDALRHYPGLRGARQRWVLVEAQERILPEIPTRLGDYAAAQLGRRGVEIRTSTRLDHADDDGVRLSDGTYVETNTLVWTAGVRPSPLLRRFVLPLDERGRVRVDPLLRVEGREHVWALGDCAAVPNLAAPGRPDPPTSQHALRQARRLAGNLTGEPQPYRYRMLGQVATLGRHRGVAEVLGVHVRGFPGWFLARTYHLLQLPLLSRKLRVVVDWTVALAFRRDIAELGLLGHPRRLDPDPPDPPAAPAAAAPRSRRSRGRSARGPRGAPR